MAPRLQRFAERRTENGNDQGVSSATQQLEPRRHLKFLPAFEVEPRKNDFSSGGPDGYKRNELSKNKRSKSVSFSR